MMCTRDNHQPWIRPAVPNRYSGEKKKEATKSEEVQGIVTPLVTGEVEAILEGKSGFIPLEPLLPNPTTHDDKNKYEIKEEDLTSLCNQSTQFTVGEPQSTLNQEGPEKQQDPANSTHFIDLGSPTGCNVRSRKTPDKNFSHYYFTDRDIKSPNLTQHAVRVDAKHEFPHQNHGEWGSEVVATSDDENHTILEQPTILDGSTTNTDETNDLESMRDMLETGYLGKSDNKTEGGISTTTRDHNDGNKSEVNEEDLTSHKNSSPQATVEEHQLISDPESPDNYQEPVNSTPPYKGPAETTSKISKSFHRVARKDPLTTNVDKILVTNAQKKKLENLVYISNDRQLLTHLAGPDQHSRATKKETMKPEEAREVVTSLVTGNTSASQHYDTQMNFEQVLQKGTEATIEE